MIQRQPNQGVILTPKGTVMVARRLYDRLEAKTKPNEMRQLGDFDWWLQLSELVNGVQIVSERRAHA